jgi:bla regulator protein BlaR1
MTETLNTFANYWYHWHIAMLWQIVVLVAIIWAADLLIRKWAHPQLRYALWMLVLIKLLIPPTLTSPTSITSHIPAITQKAVTVNVMPTNHQQPEPATESSPPVKGEYSEGGRGSKAVQAQGKDQADITHQSEAIALESLVPKPSLSWKAYAMLTWITGVITLSAWLIIRLTGLRKTHVAGDSGGSLPSWFNELLAQTARQLNLRKLPPVSCTDKVACPAVFGLFRPVLLIPASKLNKMTKQDAEHILRVTCLSTLST